MIQEGLPWEIIFHLGLLRLNSGDQPIEWNSSLVAVFRKCSMLIFVKIIYKTTISSVTCTHVKFHYENPISHQFSHKKLTCFERFATMKHYNVRKWYVAGCKHFCDPMPETRYNSFASEAIRPPGKDRQCKCEQDKVPKRYDICFSGQSKNKCAGKWLESHRQLRNI